MSTSNILLVSASAGSGKTWSLAELLYERLGDDEEVRPEAVLATTFTRKAAAELAERVRTRLMEKGLFDEAQRLAAARIGTVNSVCGSIVCDHAFELGLPPQVSVIDEQRAAEVLKQVLGQVLDTETRRHLSAIAHRLGVRKEHRVPSSMAWDDVVARIVDLAMANGLDSAAVRESGRRSLEGQLGLLGKRLPEGVDPDQGLVDAINGWIGHVEAMGDTAKGTGKVVSRLKPCRSHGSLLRQPWSEWAAVVNLKPGKANQCLDEYETVADAAALYDRHPRLRADLTSFIEGVFDAAAQVLERYAEHKAELGVIDFADQERLALEVLRNPELEESLRDELDLVLVDEFQDTSPIQLAVFVELVRLARKLVWVGDPKQSIYGFRGADPALMDACLKAVRDGGTVQNLKESWRSRPELVRATSGLFKPLFKKQDMKPESVGLEPAEKLTFPPGLGPTVELWETGDTKDRTRIAAGIAELLEDDTVRVRDRNTGEARRIRPGDVGILCRRNVVCLEVARALADIGVRSVVARPGLLATWEARAAVAALRLYVDGRDAVAKAELSRLVQGEQDLDGWLDRLLGQRYAKAMDGLEPVAALVGLAEEQRDLAALAALDRAVDAADVAGLCHRWGSTQERLSNLAQLRALAVSFVEGCAGRGIPPTAMALLAHFDKLADDDQDVVPVLADEGAVRIASWHGAKGLEWPVTVLYELWKTFEGRATGLHVVSDREGFDFADPLAGRWIRYWHRPFGRTSKNVEFDGRLDTAPETAEALAREERQEARVLYVGWTRARDRLVLTGGPDGLDKGLLELIDLPGPAGDKVTWGGVELDLLERTPAPRDPVEPSAKPEDRLAAAGPTDHPEAVVYPSSLDAKGEVVEEVDLGGRLPFEGGKDLDMANLGDAVHGFMGADVAGRTGRLDLAEGLMERWGVEGALEPSALLEAGDRLRAWVNTRWPEATWRYEWPVHHVREDGSELKGYADLVLELPEAIVVIDHKTFPGTRPQAVDKARGFAGQLGAYAEAISAAMGKPVESCWIHLPVVGLAVGVQTNPSR